NCSQQNGIVSCDLGDLGALASATVAIVARANTAGTFTKNPTGTRTESDLYPPKKKAPPPPPGRPFAVSSAHHARGEGNSGTNNMLFAVNLSAPSTNTVTVEFRSLDGTARQDEDYVAASGIVTFAPGSTHQTIAVGIRGDALYEATETFLVVLTNSVN